MRPSSSKTKTAKRPKRKVSAPKIKKASSVSATVSRAWKTFYNYVRYAFTLTGTAFERALVYAVKTFYNAFVTLFKVLFYPLLLVTRSIHYVTKSVATFFITQWKRVIGVLFIVFATTMTLDETRFTSLVTEPEPEPEPTGGRESGESTMDGAHQQQPPKTVHHHRTMQQKTKALQHTMLHDLYVPLLTFVTIGLPQLTYEMLRIWHFVLADGATSFVDMFVSSLRFAKSLLPESLQSCMQWQALESASLSTRLAQSRSKQRTTDPLLQSYVSALQTIAKKTTQLTATARSSKLDAASHQKMKDAWVNNINDVSGLQTIAQKTIKLTDATNSLKLDAESRQKMKDVWLDITHDVSNTTNHAVSKYINGNVPADEYTDVRTLTLRKAVNQLTAEPLSLFRTYKHTYWFTRTAKAPTVPTKVASKDIQRKIKKIYQAGSKKVSKYMFGKDTPEDITVQNLLHIYFGIVALNGVSSGAIEGVRNVCFDQSYTLSSPAFAARTHMTEEVIPDTFF